MPVWKALSNIRHNGTTYMAGEVIADIEDAEAEVLVAGGILARDGEQLASEAKTDVEQVAHEVVADGESLASQAEQDIQESLAQNEALQAEPSQPVTTGSPSPEDVAATAAEVQ